MLLVGNQWGRRKARQVHPEDLESLFKHWLEEHQGVILKVARAYTLTSEDCQDLIQEILLQVWRSLPQFEGRSSPCTWLFRVAINTSLSWRRQDHRRRASRQSALDVAVLLDRTADSAAQAADRELVDRMYAAIQRLPATDAALVLMYLDDLSYSQMADVLGITQTNVGVKLNRAKKALGKLMGPSS